MNDPANPVIHLPLAAVIPVLGLLLACAVLAMRALRQMVRAMDSQPDGQLPLLGSAEPGHTLLHNWDPRFKIAAIILFAFLVVSLRQPATVVAALALAVLVNRLGRLPWTRSLRRILAMNGFLAMFLVVLPLSSVVRPDDTLVVFGALADWPVNLRGLTLALVIIGKAWAVALLMEPLLATAPLGATLDGLSRLGIPRRISELLLIAHRYIHVFSGEMVRMHSGMEARAFRAGFRLATIRDYGNFVGMLLVRSFERTHRVYEAMQSRGYTGRMPHQVRFTATMADWGKLLLLTAAGIALLFGDRLLAGGV